MAYGEIVVSCPGCGSSSRMPLAAVRRDNSYCSNCGKRIPLSGVSLAPVENSEGPARPKRRPYRPTRRR